jgi:transcription elongation factor
MAAKGRNFSMSAPPKIHTTKIATPGSGGGLAMQNYNAGKQAGGKKGPSTSARMAPARSARAGNAPKARGGSKMTQGGTSADGASGLSRTNKGRQKL